MHPPQMGNTLSCCCIEDLSLKKGVNVIFANRFGISGLPDTQITPGKTYRAILCLFFFSCVLSRPQACGGETVTLQLAHMYPRKTVIITRELV